MNLIEAEKAKYDDAWSVADYGAFSPGVQNLQRFINWDHGTWLSGLSAIDLGCGPGKAGLELEALGMRVNWLDITDSALDARVPRDKFIQAPIWEHYGSAHRHWDWGFCCDVMEHI